MRREELVMICTSDIAGQLRGKAVPVRDFEKRREIGVGWTPTNIMITAHGPIAPSPWGPREDLYLRPVPTTAVRLAIAPEGPVENFVLSRIMRLDGSPWECCLRSFLERGLAALEAEGLRMLASFEHEFALEGIEERPNSPYNFDALRRQGLFAELFTAAMRENGLGPDTFMPEYGPSQYEVTMRHAPALAAADRAVMLREVARSVAHRLGLRASFTPLLRPDAVGNGVHIHFSLTDLAGRPVNHAAEGPAGLSPVAAAFLEGIRRKLPALCALTAAATISYLRLVPHRWSASYTNVGLRDREAAVRICPVFRPGTEEQALHFEYRAADAAASPYLVLGGLVWAGLWGLRQKLEAPPLTTTDPEQMSEQERTALDLRRLPGSLTDALAELEADPDLKAAMGETLHGVYLTHKRFENELMAPLDPAEQCARYLLAY